MRTPCPAAEPPPHGRRKELACCNRCKYQSQQTAHTDCQLLQYAPKHLRHLTFARSGGRLAQRFAHPLDEILRRHCAEQRLTPHLSHLTPSAPTLSSCPTASSAWDQTTRQLGSMRATAIHSCQWSSRPATSRSLPAPVRSLAEHRFAWSRSCASSRRRCRSSPRSTPQQQ